MSQSTATIQVNEFTDEERERIHNEVSKLMEREGACPSPNQIRSGFYEAFNALEAVLRCRHPVPKRMGPYLYCDECGAIEVPEPMTPAGAGSSQWRTPNLLRPGRR